MFSRLILIFCLLNDFQPFYNKAIIVELVVLPGLIIGRCISSQDMQMTMLKVETSRKDSKVERKD